MMFWKATYKNGTEFAQFDEAGENLFKHINFSQVIKFGWYGRRNYELKVKEGEHIVAFRRHRATLREDTVEQYGLGIKGRFTMLIDNSGNVEVE